MPSEELESLARRVRSLEDRAALADLLNRYCHSADTDDFEAHGDCFTEDAVLVTRMGETRGRAAIVEMNRSFAAGYEVLQHAMSNMAFQVKGDRAAGTATLRFVALPPDGQPGEAQCRGGHYEFEFRREDGQWRISRDRLRSFSIR